MNRALIVTILLFAASGRAQGVDAPLTPPVPEEPRAAHAIWTTSLMDWGLTLLAPFLGVGLHVALPVGLNLRLSDTTDWVFEVAPSLTREPCTNVHGDPVKRCGSYRALKGSVGIAWTPSPGARGAGLFIQPKLGGMWTQDRARGTDFTGAEGGERRETGGQVTFGFDVGYRKTAARSRSFLAPVLGVGVGYSWNQRRGRVAPNSVYLIPRATEWKNEPIIEVNLDILRWGATF